MKHEPEYDDCDSGFPPFARGSDTSFDAADSMAPHTPTLRARVLEYVRSFCWVGSTCDQAEIDLSLAHQTCSARFWELHNAGLIIDSGRRRKTRTGRSAAVWVCVKFKREVDG